MTKKVEMGGVYFQLDNTPSSREKLITFFEDNYCVCTDTEDVHIFEVMTLSGYIFHISWYKNYCKVLMKHEEGIFFECPFDTIIGSFSPYFEHASYDFCYNGKRTTTLYLSEEECPE